METTTTPLKLAAKTQLCDLALSEIEHLNRELCQKRCALKREDGKFFLDYDDPEGQNVWIPFHPTRIVGQVQLLTALLDAAGEEPAENDALQQIELSKKATRHVLSAICDDPQKYFLMGGKFSGSFDALARAHAALWDYPYEKILKDFQPNPRRYQDYLDERQANEALLEHCRENNIILPED